MTETVLVTGGRGRSGRWICDRLADDGYEVVVVDLDHQGWGVPAREGVSFRAADLTDRGETLDLLADRDPDAVVHWAAIPTPEKHPPGTVFENNALAAYNVLVGAGRAGARTVVASSESTYGFPFARDDVLPDYLPVDEAHPTRPEDAYGTSKVVTEELGDMVARRYGIPVASIRPSWIQYPGEYTCVELRGDRAEGAGNFWSYVDVRDVAGIVAAALESPPDGHEPVLAVADETYLEEPTAEAIRDYFGGLPDECAISGTECAFSNARARDLLGWEPEHAWRGAMEEDVPEPTLLAD